MNFESPISLKLSNLKLPNFKSLSSFDDFVLKSPNGKPFVAEDLCSPKSKPPIKIVKPNTVSEISKIILEKNEYLFKYGGSPEVIEFESALREQSDQNTDFTYALTKIDKVIEMYSKFEDSKDGTKSMVNETIKTLIESKSIMTDFNKTLSIQV